MVKASPGRPIRRRNNVHERLVELKAEREKLERLLRERLMRYQPQVLAMERRFNVEISLKEMRDLTAIQQMEARLKLLKEQERSLRQWLRAA